MSPLTHRTGKSARRGIAVALLGVLAVLVGSLTVGAAGGKPDFKVAASPSSQTVTKGQRVSYTVVVSRVNGFSEPVTLTAAGLPSGTTASWKLSDGTGTNVVPATRTSATLTVQTTAATPGGTANLTIDATGGKLARSTPVALVVEPPTQPGFSLTASPAARTVLDGDETTYTFGVQRTGGFAGPVSLAVTGLPKGATATWVPGSTVAAGADSATLAIATDKNVKTGAHDLVVTGTGTDGATTIQRAAAVTLVVDRGHAFGVSGDLAGALAPGREVTVDLVLSNPNNFAIRVHSLSVALEERTSRPGCSGTESFAVTESPESIFPLVVGAGETRTLSSLGVPVADRPRVRMTDTGANQDACKGATIGLQYGGTAGK